jgi:predicted Zn-dependent protease
VAPLELLPAERARLSERWLAPALREYLQARDLCPILPEAQLGLAAHARDLARADPPEEYLRRAELLAPADPQIWYLAGLQALASGAADEAWAAWRRSLELSPTYLPQILVQAAAFLSPEETAAKVLPRRPDRLVAAADRPFPGAEDTARRVFLQQALLRLREQPGPLGIVDLRLQAQVQKRLGQTTEAAATYKELLAQAPTDPEVRYEYARLLYEMGRLTDAQRELQFLLAQNPRHAQGRELLRIVEEELARRG